MEGELPKRVIEFLLESNHIENEYSKGALIDAQLAWKFAFSYINEIDIYMIMGIHKILMNTLRPDIAGKFRNVPVVIKGRIKEEPMHMIILKLTEWCDTYHGMRGKKERHIRKAHVEFEDIHPFEDGNGRVGRILYGMHYIQAGIPLRIIRNSKKQEYYKWFR